MKIVKQRERDDLRRSLTIDPSLLPGRSFTTRFPPMSLGFGDRKRVVFSDNSCLKCSGSLRTAGDKLGLFHNDKCHLPDRNTSDKFHLPDRTTSDKCKCWSTNDDTQTTPSLTSMDYSGFHYRNSGNGNAEYSYTYRSYKITKCKNYWRNIECLSSQFG